MSSIRLLWLLGLLAMLGTQDNATEVPVQTLYAGNDRQKMYLLIGAGKESPPPKEGYRLLLILPGGDGSAEFLPFCKRIYQHALNRGYIVAQLVAPKWSEAQFEQVVWPTRGLGWQDAQFTTEEFIEAVVADAKKRYSVAPRFVFALGWSSGGPPVYSAMLQKETSLRGAFVAMSVYKPNQLPPREHARGRAFYILHSPEDFIPIRMAQQAEQELRQHGARVHLQTYEGGHGWHGDIYGIIRKGIQWLEQQVE
ncbi:MAG: alpha/beta hydrolase [Fimbriimonadales bacterium]